MVITLKKIQHSCTGRNCVVLPYSVGAHNNRGNAHKLLHSIIKTTMTYTQVSNHAINRIPGPLDSLNLEIENKSNKKSMITLGG